MASWSTKNAGNSSGSSGRYYVFSGRAYPRIRPGANPTRQIEADRTDRQRFYRDPAVDLSDADMDAFDGAEGSPLCVEHEPADVVGSVYHTWLGDGETRALKVLGRISLDTERGRTVAEEVRAGKFKGLSVSYLADVDDDNYLHEKKWREISLVEDPFFENCRLASYGITASKQATNNVNHMTNRGVMELQIQASRILGGDNMSAEQQQQPPSGSPPVPAEELLQQTHQLKAQWEEERKKNEATVQLNKQMEEQLARYRAKEAEEAKKYAEAQAPKAQAYIEALTASLNGKPVPEKMAKEFLETFTNPQYKDAADMLETQGKHMVALAASAKSAEERAAAAEAQAKSYQSAVAKTSEILNHSRGDYAAAAAPIGTAPSATKQMEPIDASRTAGLQANHILMPTPSASELPFLRAYGYRASSEVGVAASALEPGERMLPRSIPIAAGHKNLTDLEGNPRLLASWRKQPVSAPMFSWMCAQEELRSEGTDLADMVKLVASKEMYERKAADAMATGANV